MSSLSWKETVRYVHERADYQCEYCQTGQRVIGQPMHLIRPDCPLPSKNTEVKNRR